VLRFLGLAPKLLEMTLFFLLSLLALSNHSLAHPRIGSPWAQMLKEPLLQAEPLSLAPTWGPALPIGNDFRVEKVFGRWLFGTPAPLSRMKQKDFSPKGWIYSRHLLAPGDRNAESEMALAEVRSTIFFSRLEIKGTAGDQIRFLDSLVLSQRTLQALSTQDERAISLWNGDRTLSELWGSKIAWAEEGVGLVGSDLNFLKEEWDSILRKRAAAERERKLRTLQAPAPPKRTRATDLSIQGRKLLLENFRPAPLSPEEVDGHLYMRALSMRALNGCEPAVQAYWKNRSFRPFRVLNLKNQSSELRPWIELALPGGVFVYSARAMDMAANEAELAFLLVRSLVREFQLSRLGDSKESADPATKTPVKTPPLPSWSDAVNRQSSKINPAIDVGQETAADLAAIRCIGGAGYRPMAGLNYIRRLASEREQPWARWPLEHQIGWTIRVDKTQAEMGTLLKTGEIKEGSATNPKRFATALRFWNVIP
jgi:hypothetical protein